MKTFKEFLEDIREQALAQKGNLKDYGELLQDMKSFVVDDFTELLTKIKLPGIKYNLEVRKINNRPINKPDYIIGFWTTESRDTKSGEEKIDIFRVIFAMQVSNKKLNIKGKEYSNVINIDGVFTEESVDFRGKGLSSFMYNYLVNNLGFTILGDSEQYLGARKLWSLLSKSKELVVDIIDIKNNTLIKNNIILHQGRENDDFDKQLWSDGIDNKEVLNFRSILTKIKG